MLGVAFLSGFGGFCGSMPFASLSLFLLEVCMCPVALQHFLGKAVFCIYPGLVIMVGKAQGL